MSDNTLKELLKTHAPRTRDSGAVVRVEEDVDYKAFAFGRVSLRPQLMIEFCKADGYHLVLPYADLRLISSPDPDQEFALEFTGRKVAISGLNLSSCFRYLRENRVAILMEAEPAVVMDQSDDEPVIARIVITKVEKPPTKSPMQERADT
jgi:hypothetical protein